MIVIDALQAIPNQEFTITLDAVNYDIVIRETNGCMSVDITRAGDPVVKGQRAVAGEPILPYTYLEGSFGNFAFLTDTGDLPYYDQFGVSQILIFATTAEIGAIRNGTA